MFQVQTDAQPTNEQFRLICSGSAQRGPNYPVPGGSAVYVRGHNGTVAGNTSSVAIGTDIGQVGDYVPANGTTGQNQLVDPGVQVGFPCSNLNQLFFKGNAADGLQITILG